MPIQVVAAVIRYQDKILCVQRGESKYSYISKKYEFPGGKVEPNESEKQALIREIKEELNLEIEVNSKLLSLNHHYPDFEINIHAFDCSCTTATIELTEHMDYKWLSTKELSDLDWAAADLPIVELLEKMVV